MKEESDFARHKNNLVTQRLAHKIDQVENRSANKASSYWASMRTNIALASRSELVDEVGIDKIREELQNILDSGIITYPHTLEQHGLKPDMTLNERKIQFGLATKKLEHTEEEQRFLDDMAIKADLIRKSNWSWRIGQEATEKHKLGWHPFFVTLTVYPDYCDGREREVKIDGNDVLLPGYDSPKDLWMTGREFRKYIRRLANVVSNEMGHSPPHKKPYRPESDYVTYAGVIEHGKSREHHHGHFVIWLRAIPGSWRICPNYGIGDPSRRLNNECKQMREYWPWSLPGLSPALYFRSIGDIWEKGYNFVLPLQYPILCFLNSRIYICSICRCSCCNSCCLFRRICLYVRFYYICSSS